MPFGTEKPEWLGYQRWRQGAQKLVITVATLSRRLYAVAELLVLTTYNFNSWIKLVIRKYKKFSHCIQTARQRCHGVVSETLSGWKWYYRIPGSVSYSYAIVTIGLRLTVWGRPSPSELWLRDRLEKGHYSRWMATQQRYSGVRVEFYLYPTVSTALVHSVKPKLTE